MKILDMDTKTYLCTTTVTGQVSALIHDVPKGLIAVFVTAERTSMERKVRHDEGRDSRKRHRSHSPLHRSRDRERENDGDRDRDRHTDRDRSHDAESERGRREREKSGSRERDDLDRDKARERERERRRKSGPLSNNGCHSTAVLCSLLMERKNKTMHDGSWFAERMMIYALTRESLGDPFRVSSIVLRLYSRC
ncbi:hypothetical protein ACLOJK_002580 [Asimina triloba]